MIHLVLGGFLVFWAIKALVIEVDAQSRNIIYSPDADMIPVKTKTKIMVAKPHGGRSVSSRQVSEISDPYGREILHSHTMSASYGGTVLTHKLFED